MKNKRKSKMKTKVKSGRESQWRVKRNGIKKE